MRKPRIPTATYRLQLGEEQGFAAVASLIDYLELLGVSDVYLSPIQAPRCGSVHGYDIVDHGRLNPDLGADEDLRRLGRRLRDRGMGLIVDVVPNHMCVADPGNRWWTEVLENGPSAPSARFFDIDWSPPKPDLAARVLLPVLGDQYGRVLESGDITVAHRAGAFVVSISGMELPLAPRSWPHLLEPALQTVRADRPEDDPGVEELESVLLALAHLPPRTETDAGRVRERLREKEIIKRRIAALVEADAGVSAAISAAVEQINGKAGEPRSFDALEALLADQAYRVSFWRVASDEINYRRFFDINELAAIRVEEPRVFAAVHGLLLGFIGEGVVTGLRIDHVDGLASPERYLQDLSRACLAALPARSAPPYIVVEKILLGRERLPASWPVAGTTGYDFLAAVNGLFVVPEGVTRARRAYEALTGASSSFADVAYHCKKLILRVSLSSELTMLARRLDRVSEQHRYSRDFTLNGLQEALAEVIACFPVYRTYIGEDDASATLRDADRAVIAAAIREAKRRDPAVSESIFDFIASALLLEEPEGLQEEDRAERRELVLRFQQLTAPVMAKGAEDTAFYAWVPFVSLNEVGGDPGSPGLSIAEFHAMNERRAAERPGSLNATSTHDTKRSEDVRARINVLSEIPDEWLAAEDRFRAMNARLKTDIGGLLVPGPAEEHLFYQTLVGAWPIGPARAEERRAFPERIARYMEKAAREAKVHTSWISPNVAFDRALLDFVRRATDPEESAAFLNDLSVLCARIERPALLAACSQVLLKIASPGIPDFYQGSELHPLLLVDPDNRGPVDFEERRALLQEVRRRAEEDLPALAAEMVAAPEDGRLKLHVIHRALALRRRLQSLFDEGAYVPLPAEGPRAAHAVAFARVRGEAQVIAVAGRFFAALGDRPIGATWDETVLPLPGPLQGGRWRDMLAGDTIEVEGSVMRLGRALGRLPFALLSRGT